MSSHTLLFCGADITGEALLVVLCWETIDKMVIAQGKSALAIDFTDLVDLEERFFRHPSKVAETQ